MPRLLISISAMLICAGALEAQGVPRCDPGMAPIKDAPVVELRGTISQVRIAPGLGMPSILVKTGSVETAVLLGPMRYLIMQNFNPKLGEDVVVKAFKTAGGAIAASVTLAASRKTLQLRGEDGRPLWRGGGRW